MAAQKIQIADKPTLDEVATDVEALKELVTTIGKKVGVVELEEGETVSVIGSSDKPPEYVTPTSTGLKNYSYEGKGKLFISIYINGITNSSYGFTNLVVDGVSMSTGPFMTHVSSNSNSYIYEVPFKKSISFDTGLYNTSSTSKFVIMYD